MKLKLKPCPFCGATGPVMSTNPRLSEDGFYYIDVHCTRASCYARTEFVFSKNAIQEKHPNASENELIENMKCQTVECWNRRAE